MRKCLKCKNVFNDSIKQCPECGLPLYHYSSEDMEKDKQKRLKQQKKQIIVAIAYILAFIMTFLLGFGLKSCTSIKREDYNKLKYKNKELSDEYKAYKEKMQPYEKVQLADAENRAEKERQELAEKKAAAEKAEAETKAQKEAEEKAAAEKAAAEAASKAAEEAKGYETGITFDNLARTPDTYKGKKVKFEGRVIQVIEGASETQLRFAVNDDYDKVIFCRVPKYKTSSTRILEDDYIHIMGISNGLISYQSTFGGTITIPDVSVDDWGQS